VDEQPPPEDSDPFLKLLRVLELGGLVFYCLVILYQSQNQGELTRQMARNRARLTAWWGRVTAADRARREAPFLIWEAWQAMASRHE
jgi:hypothetical protein